MEEDLLVEEEHILQVAHLESRVVGTPESDHVRFCWVKTWPFSFPKAMHRQAVWLNSLQVPAGRIQFFKQVPIQV